jgi:predicted GNAT family N-acyltransferase
MVPLGLLLHALDISGYTVRKVGIAIVAFRLLTTLVRACRAYSHDARLLACFPQSTARRWRLDYVAAFPAGAGHGTRLLKDFLRFADERDAEVTLNCDSDLVAYYRRHGFRRIEAPMYGQVLMLRQARSVRRRPRPAATLQVAGG